MKTRIYARIAVRLLLTLLGVASFYPSLTHAQTFDLDASRIPLTQVDSAWRFHLGDDPNWAQPSLNDSSWPVLRPKDDWTTQGYPIKSELAWFRFHLLVPAHTQSLVLNLPGIEKSFQLFCDGQLIGQVGTLPPGPAHNVIGAPRVFTLPVNSGLAPKKITVALRIWQDPATAGARVSVLEGTAYAGSPEAVLGHFATEKAANLLSYGSSYITEIVRVIVGAATILLFWFTRERFYLWFAFNLLLDFFFVPIDLASAHQAWGLYFTTGIIILIDFLSRVAYIGFFVSVLHSDKTEPVFLPAAL